MRSALVIETPDKCKDCPLSYWSIDGLNCKPLRKMIEDDKPDWCPLRPLPDREDPSRLKEGTYFKAYDQGWNDCLDEIMGETE